MTVTSPSSEEEKKKVVAKVFQITNNSAGVTLDENTETQQ